MSLDNRWERVRSQVSPVRLRMTLALLSLVAMVLGGAANERWG